MLIFGGCNCRSNFLHTNYHVFGQVGQSVVGKNWRLYFAETVGNGQNLPAPQKNRAKMKLLIISSEKRYFLGLLKVKKGHTALQSFKTLKPRNCTNIYNGISKQFSGKRTHETRDQDEPHHTRFVRASNGCISPHLVWVIYVTILNVYSIYIYIYLTWWFFGIWLIPLTSLGC